MFVTDEKEPQLIAVDADRKEIDQIAKQVDVMNQWLVDSGFDQYKYTVAIRGQKVYIERE